MRIPDPLQSIWMEPLSRNKIPVTRLFLLTAMSLLAIGMVFGVIGGLQYVIQGFFKPYLSFDKIRPLHVSSVVFWIILCAVGGVMTYLQQHTGRRLYSPLLAKIQYSLFAVSIGAILISYALGIFGGREYWEFHPWFAIPLFCGWILFLINFIASVGPMKKQPVYIWQWMTGVVFFLFTYAESYLWLIPYFRNNVVNDMTIQWKSYGSMVGSWNMLIYGCSLFLMTKISGNSSMCQSKMAFALYFTGLFNLMFNWGHHIYTLPTHDYVKHISYIVSMTELVILGRIIWQWKSTLSEARKHLHRPAFRFIAAADVWVFLTLVLAIAMSVPAINVYTHGTHVTVAHTMGATIGINTFLLLAIATDILGGSHPASYVLKKWFRRGFVLANISLLVFWISLITAGILKAKWQMEEVRIPFSSMMLQLRPVFVVFVMAGIFLMLGVWMILYTLFRYQWGSLQEKKGDSNIKSKNEVLIEAIAE
jgi:nitric oxide reductase subunit B